VELSPKLKLPIPCSHENRLHIHILRTDHFGNIITDLTRATYAAWNSNNVPLKFEFMHACFTATVTATYADVPQGAPVAYFGSSGHLEIAICNGNAAGYFKAARGFSIALDLL
jgi:S-adenosylmethionine hydrolase